MRDRANKAAQASEVPDESLSLVARRRKVREVEHEIQIVPETQDKQDNQELITQRLQSSPHFDDEDAGISQTKLVAKRRRMIDSDEDE